MPWYYMHSGLPQPVDVVIILTLFLFTILKRPYLNLLQYSSIYKMFLYFIIFTIVTLLINFIDNESAITINLIIQNIYYFILMSVYLFIIVNIFQYYNHVKSYNIILFLVFLGCLLPMLDWIFYVRNLSSGRIALTFNNPNQLGFFSLVNISIVYYLGLLAKEAQFKLNKWIALAILNSSLFFLFLSASRACYPVILLYIFCYFIIFDFNFSGASGSLFKILSILLGTFFCIFLLYEWYVHMKSIRLSRLAVNYDGIIYDFYFRALRGIDFNTMSLWELLIGRGEHSLHERGTLEFHNNFIALFNQTGLLGLLLYIYVNLLIIINLIKKSVLYFLPFFCYLFYSTFQYSLRTRPHWLFIAIIIFVSLHHRFSNQSTEYT